MKRSWANRIALLVGLGACTPPPAVETTRFAGTLADISTHVDALRRGDCAVLIVELPGTEDFLQFTADGEILQLGFPVITPRQQGLEGRLRAVAALLNLSVTDSRGTDGTRFVDVALQAREASSAIARMFQELYGVTEQSALRFTCHGCRAA